MPTQARSRKKVVVLGGGTGVFTLLVGLKNYFESPTAIVSMADSGGSTGVLREEFGILPPGDIRRALVALSESDNKTLSELMNFRFEEGRGLKGHSFGNLLLTALERITGSFERAVEEASRILGVRGTILPVTLESTQLVAELEDGTVVRGETNIDIPKHDGTLRITRAWLEPEVSANPKAVEAVREADLVVLGPGDLYTSIVPNLLAEGMKSVLRKTRGKVVYVSNLMTKFGETNGFRVSDFVRTMEEYTGEGVIDTVLAPEKEPEEKRLVPYGEEQAEWVLVDREHIEGAHVVLADLVREEGFVRHDSEKTARTLAGLLC